jgi:integrase
MAVFKRNGWYQYEFLYGGKRVQESARTKSKTIAKEAERKRREELERAAIGLPAEGRADRIASVAEKINAYLESYHVNHRAKSIAFATGRLENVRRLLGSVLLSDLKEREIRRYMAKRIEEGVCGRTINAELGELSRAIGSHWRVLWPKVRKMEERKDVGKALSGEEEQRIKTALLTAHSPVIGVFVRIALLTAMRSGEIQNLTWGQIDLNRQHLTVGRAKTSSGTGRIIPLNNELLNTLIAHRGWFLQMFGDAKQDWFLFPFGKPTPNDPTRPMTTIKTAWNALRKSAGVQCRLHDLRHTAATKMAESGASDSAMLSIMGHMSRAMLERYSHIRMAAKRSAVECLSSVPYSAPTPANSPAREESLLLN